MAKSPTGAGRMVSCWGLMSGETELFAAEAIRFRPAAYGLYVRGSRILLGRSRFTGKWDIPGGGVEPWETLEDGVVREFHEETGARVWVERLIDVRESFIAFGRHPFHSLRYYYLVSGEGGEKLVVDPDELLSVAWVELAEVHPDECASGDFDLIRSVLA